MIGIRSLTGNPIMLMRQLGLPTLSASRATITFTRRYSQLLQKHPRTSPLYQFKRPASLLNFAKYSTKTAPPPPPPPSTDKNARGRAILNRISRIFTFSISSVLVVGALGVAGLVVYLILSELFLPSGDTKTFNKAVKLIEQNENAQKTLNFAPGERLKAYGEVAGDKWVRNRPVQSIRQRGTDGKDRLVMRFHVESASGRHASVVLEQIDTSFWSSEFAYIALELPSKHRIYVVDPKFSPQNYVPRSVLGKNNGFLGLKWGPKKDD